MVLASVIIPAYNGAQYLGEAIQSVLNQTYSHFELIVVDDASTDQTVDVLKQFSDTRLKYYIHPRNMGADNARKTGLDASSGEYIFLLDQDDLFHQKKLQKHVEFLETYPDVGLTYNNRFEFNYSKTTIRELWRPPQAMTLKDLVLGFPIAPSDVVMRREWAES
jgi:glycosyltransferase involved in cell wall biosynthesis